MNGFAEAAVGLAYIANLAALSTILSFAPASVTGTATQALLERPAAVTSERPRAATQKLMRNPWDRKDRYLVAK